MNKTKRRRPTHRSPEQWQDLINQHAYSGTSIEALCKQNDLTPSNFYYWRKQLASNTNKPGLFARIETQAEPSDTWRIELTLAPGVVLRMA